MIFVVEPEGLDVEVEKTGEFVEAALGEGVVGGICEPLENLSDEFLLGRWGGVCGELIDGELHGRECLLLEYLNEAASDGCRQVFEG